MSKNAKSRHARRRYLRDQNTFELCKPPSSQTEAGGTRRNKRRPRLHRFHYYPPGPIRNFQNPNKIELRVPQLSVLPFTPHPVWTQPQNNYGSNRWVVYSPKLGRLVILYSDLERDHWVLREADPDVLEFCEQPLRVSVRLPSGTVATIFDFWIKWRGGREELLEVKYKDQLEGSLRVKRQLEAQATWTTLISFPYSVVTEDAIRANPIFLANWKRILCHLGPRSRADLPRETDQVRGLLARFGLLPIAELERRLSHLDCALVRTALYKLVHAGKARALGLETRSLDGFTLVEEVRDDN